MIQNKKWTGFLKRNKLYVIFMLFFAVYYAVKMFTNRPWYDELYTYYSFISRGPVYAAIHWPVPNNHVLYSVLSACLDVFGNPYIGLRGVSYLAAVANLILIRKIACRLMDERFGNCTAFIYAAIFLINSMSIQGRGYTLSTTCYLLAIDSLVHICTSEDKRRFYIVFMCSLAAGLYILPSSTYWVLPICFVGGINLLLQKEYKKLWKLIGVSVLAACITFFFYLLIWLAIGANLMSKDVDGMFYGIYQVTIILHHPIQAMMTGINYMLNTPYIQSIDRKRAITELFSYLSLLYNMYFPGLGSQMTVLLLLGGIVTGLNAISERKTLDHTKRFVAIYLCSSIFLLPVMLLIQSVQPYLRVFTFFGVVVAIMFAYLLYLCASQYKLKPQVTMGLYVVTFVWTILLNCSASYNTPYAGRENEIADCITREDTKDIHNMCYLDDDQKYVLKFYYDFEPNEVSLEEADAVLLPKENLDPNYSQAIWPLLYSYEDLNYTYIEENFKKIRENDGYIYYHR